jgi:hypothetical protein
VSSKPHRLTSERGCPFHSLGRVRQQIQSMSRTQPLNTTRPSGMLVNIGGMSKADILVRLEAAGIQLNSLAHAIFEDDNFQTQEQESSIEVVFKTVSELGFTNGSILEYVIDAACSLGFGLCPLELGPHLRLTYSGQEEGAVGFAGTQHTAPPGSFTVIDQLPNRDDSEYKGFYLRRIDGRLWLRGYTSWAGHVWQPEDMLVFTSALYAHRTGAASRGSPANSNVSQQSTPNHAGLSSFRNEPTSSIGRSDHHRRNFIQLASEAQRPNHEIRCNKGLSDSTRAICLWPQANQVHISMPNR